jgi:hypothetical protein
MERYQAVATTTLLHFRVLREATTRKREAFPLERWQAEATTGFKDFFEIFFKSVVAQ